MAQETMRYRGHGWAAFVYLVIAIIALFLMISSSMSDIHATGEFDQPLWVLGSTFGVIVGLAGLIFTIVRARRSNVNLRGAVLSWMFGIVVFGLALAGAVRFGTGSDTAPGVGSAKLAPSDYQ